MLALYEQSRKLNNTTILQISQETVQYLLAYNARRLRKFRNLPYLVMLNPAISELYDMYLESMAILLRASLNLPTTLKENDHFTREVLSEFIAIHADALPTLSKGFAEVMHLITEDQVKLFLDQHLSERISMRLIAHQHILLSESLGSKSFVKGGNYNGVIKELNIREVIKKNVDFVNDICQMKYDQTCSVKIDINLPSGGFWNLRDDSPDTKPKFEDDPIIFPYIEYHLDYIFQECFKNSFRAQIENDIVDPVLVTVSACSSPSYLELRIRDRGKGIPPSIVDRIFDYSYTTYDSGEGDNYKTLNVPPGLGGNTVAGMGYGLPLLKNYIEIFNDTLSYDPEDGSPKPKGLLSVQTYWGWGTDIYLKTVGH